MTYEALLKVAPILTLERYNDPRWNRPGRSMYEPGSLRFAPAVSSVPLLVDHRDDREVGVVHELFRAEWVDGPWVCARATVSLPARVAEEVRHEGLRRLPQLQPAGG
jgi:hypothetical protein